MEDKELIKNIKNNKDADNCLNVLFERHSGIFFKMINAYVPNGSGFADKEELIKDAKYYIYKIALDYDENKKTKFSTYLGNRTRWMCLNMYNKSKRAKEIPQEEKDFNKIESSTKFK